MESSRGYEGGMKEGDRSWPSLDHGFTRITKSCFAKGLPTLGRSCQDAGEYNCLEASPD